MRRTYIISGFALMFLGLGAASTGSAFAACLSPDVATPPVSLSHNDMSDRSDNGAWSKGFGYDRDAYLAALAKGNSCGINQQSEPVSATRMHHARPTQTSY